MSCKYKNECPSYSGWCEGPKQDFARCIPFLISCVETARAELKAIPIVFYKCDRRACETCRPECCHLTKDIRHAENFQVTALGVMVEGGDENGV